MGFKQDKNIPPMERELNYLLYDLCVIWGFCIPPDYGQKISQTESYNAKEFAKDVITAEGMNPEHETKWMKRISEKFKERFGDNEINESTFVDRVRDIKENW